MRSHARAANAGSNTRQANGPGRVAPEAVALRVVSDATDGSRAPSNLAFLLSLCAALVAFAVLALPASAENLGRIGKIEAVGGAGAGAVSTPRTLATNRTGAGGVDAGDVYVLDGNNRVSEFSASGTFVRAFGYDVVSSGEHDIGVAPEVCEAVSSPTDICKVGVANTFAGSIDNAQGLVVDQTNGNVFVYEVGNRRVSVFSAKGVFQGAFGWKVKAGAEAAAALQFCTSAGTGCQAGENSSAAAASAPA